MHTEYRPPVPATQQIFTEAAIIPFDRNNVPAVREEYTQAIQLWFQTRDVAEALTREEIGGMKAFDRFDATRKAIILHLADYYRSHPKSDVAPGILVLTALLSDNDRGGASISQPALATFFGRSVSAVGDARKRLKDRGAITSTPGRYSLTSPVIPRAVTKSYNHLTWLIAAISDCERGPLNLPAPPVHCQSTDQTGSLSQSTDQAGSLGGVNQPVEAVSINRPDRMLIHYKNSKEERGPREGSIGKVAAGILAATASSVMPLAAAPHPVEQVRQCVAECWQTPKGQMEASLNIQEARAQKQIWVTATGGLEIAGDFKTEMQRMFPLVDLTSALAAACVNVRVESGAWNAMQLVRRQFGFMQQDALKDERRRQANSAKYAKNSPDRERDLNAKFMASVQVPMQKPRPAGEDL